MLSDFEVMLSLLPEDFDSLQAEECCFCTGKPQKRVTYGMIDLGHSEPESKRGMFFGIGKKVRQKIGSLLPISISICKSCRHNFRVAESLKWIMMLIFLGIAIALCFLPSVNGNAVLPYAVILVGVLLGYISGKVLSAMYVKAKSSVTRFSIFEIPACAQMKRDGWFTVQDEGMVSRLIFNKKPMLKKLSDLGISIEKKAE